MDQYLNTETWVHCEEDYKYLCLRHALVLRLSLILASLTGGWGKKQSRFSTGRLKNDDRRSDNEQLPYTHQSKKSVARKWLSIRTLQSSYG